MTIAFLYNIRHQYPNPNDPRTHLETDNDDPETIKAMIANFEKCGYTVIPIEADLDVYHKLEKNKKKIDLAFNYSVGIDKLRRELQVPLLLEILKIPYTGQTPFVQSLAYNKAKIKDILMAHNIPTLPYQLFKSGEEKLLPNLSFPLIVKPNGEGSSAGITNKSVVKDLLSLKRQIKNLMEIFKQPVLVEPFLTGREFSVPLIGNPPLILPIIESDHSVLPKNYQPLDSLEVKWYFEDQSKKPYFHCPAKIEKKLEEKIINIVTGAFQYLGFRDLCRIDIRCDKSDQPYFLDINHPPGLIPPEVSQTSYFPLSARAAGIDYPKLIKTIIETALNRYK